MTPPPSARNHAPEIRALTGARVIPVLLIVLFHYHEWFGYTGRDWYDAVVSKGYIWVEFFFGLSGFILFYVYGPRFGERLRARAIGAFLAARVSRIYPLQLATLLVAVVVEVDRRIDQSRVTGVSFWNVPSYPGRTWDTLVSNVFMIQAWNIHDVMSWNPVAWFVSAEFLLYLACPALMMLAGARFGWRTMAIWAASIALLVPLPRSPGPASTSRSTTRSFVGWRISASACLSARYSPRAWAGSAENGRCPRAFTRSLRSGCWRLRGRASP